MEASNRARKGFTKGKLVMSFYRAPKPQSTSSTVQYNNSSSSNSNSGVVINHDKYVAAQPRLHKVSEIGGLDDSSYTTTFENSHHYGVVAGDESVDLKAASYISCVQERFRLDWVNSERKMTQEMQY
ncbi:hypothetical protein LOK49_LG04G03515 [Camellia lanceoleosa]|uniref:Uncharacterized protein n=1 Tax=Camellia lanceoleosa TaxID=1840588 RepID=A0ACC0I0R6_9ERIC|nr:hypothetical protein LOK49_LG04G03515 [Camellia lanceoleosa]